MMKTKELTYFKQMVEHMKAGFNPDTLEGIHGLAGLEVWRGRSGLSKNESRKEGRVPGHVQPRERNQEIQFLGQEIKHKRMIDACRRK